MFADRILALGRKFKGRLEDGWLDVALDYVDDSEETLAFETLCDYIAEFDIPISTEEYDEIMKLAVDMEIDLNLGCIKYLKEIIK